MNKYNVKHLIMSNGERAKLLVDATGMPLYYPNLFITTQVRGSGKASGTENMFLQALKVLLMWQEQLNINLVSRFRNKEFLTEHEIISLRDHCAQPLRKSDTFHSKVIPLFMQSMPNVSNNTQYNRMTAISSYLSFLANAVNTRSENSEVRKQIEFMVNCITAHRPRQSSRYSLIDEDRALKPETANLIFEITQPDHPENPFNESVRLRNMIMLAILRFTGVRRSELLNIQVADINFQENILKIKRRPDSSEDNRKHQPNVKTSERTIPLNDVLIQRIHIYILNERRSYPAAKRHNYLFVAHQGPRTGQPLTIATFDKMFEILKIVTRDNSVSPHRFRHYWNFEFSKAIDDAHSRMSPEAEEQMRSYLMGWSPTSGQAANYNRRRIKQDAHQALREHQNKLKSLIEEGLNDQE